nr:MAG TPA: hypothetical protein [Caudoviricetes sp.]
MVLNHQNPYVEGKNIHVHCPFAYWLARPALLGRSFT